MDSAPRYPLRALGVGEIFDRAITIYVRNFAIFTLMVLTLLAPLNVVEYFAIPNSGSTFAQAVDQIEHPQRHPKGVAPSGPALGLFLAALAAFLLLSPFVAGAVAVGVAAVYNGKHPSYAHSFVSVLQRWPAILGTAMMQFLIFFGAYFIASLALATWFIVAALSMKPAAVLGVLLFVAGGALAVVVLLGFLLLLLTYAFSSYAAALEDAGVGTAIACAYRRIFNRREIGKALLMGLSYIALEFGVLVVSSMIGIFLLYIVKSYALQLAVNAVVTSALTAFLTIIVAVYYYDVRTRSEGLDLEVELQRLSAV